MLRQQYIAIIETIEDRLGLHHHVIAMGEVNNDY
jgi:hypothetical protein